MTTRRSRTFSAAVWSACLGQGAQFTAKVLSGILISRFMGPAGRGLYAAAQLYPVAVQGIAELGARQALIKVAASRRFSPRELFASMAVVYAGAVTVGLGLVVILGLCLGNPLLTPTLVLLGAANLPPALAIVYLRGLLVGSGRVRAFSSLGTIAPALGLLLVAGLIAGRRLSPPWALVASVAANIPPLCIGLSLVPRGGRADIRMGAVREVTALGWRMAVLSIVATFGSRIPMILLQLLRPVDEIGIYAVASALAELPFQITAAMNAVTVARSAGATDRSRFLLEYLQVHRMLVWACLALSVAAALLAPIAIPIVYGRDFAPAAQVLWWLAPSVVAGLSVRLLSYDSAGQGRPLEAAIMMLPGPAIALMVGLIAVPRWGMHGAAFSASAGAVVNALGMGVRFVRHNQVKPWQVCGVVPDDWRRGMEAMARMFSSRKGMD